MCAGRFFAKSEVIATVSLFLRAFEIELVDPAKAKDVKLDTRYTFLGALPPNCKIPVRMRRRRSEQR